MPTALVLHLEPESPRARPQFPAQYAHGLFYHLLGAINPELGDAIHAAKRVPFTLAARFEGGACLLRVALLDDTLFAPLLRVMVEHSLTGLSLGQDQYRVARVLATADGHPRAGRTTWEEIHRAAPLRSLRLRFLTPTVFATSRQDGQRHFTPLPEPRLVLGSLLRSLQTFSPLPYGPGEAAYFTTILEEHFAVTQLKVHTETHYAGRHPYTGFLGDVELRFQDDALEVRRLLGQLAALAPFSGAGTKTPYGMGQIAVLEAR